MKVGGVGVNTIFDMSERDTVAYGSGNKTSVTLTLPCASLLELSWNVCDTVEFTYRRPISKRAVCRTLCGGIENSVGDIHGPLSRQQGGIYKPTMQSGMRAGARFDRGSKRLPTPVVQ